jgi:putative phage-type endonuclease
MSFHVVCHSRDEHWLEARRSGIGASEISAVLGLDKYTSEVELYLRKTGQAPDDDAGEAAEWGQRLEPVIAAEFGKRTGRTVAMAGSLLRSVAHPWALATLDAWQMLPDGREWPLEVKLTGGRARDWEAGVPEYYYPQVQQQLLVTGAKFASIAALLNGTRLVWCDVERDEEMIARIVSEGSRFWSCVTDESVPPPDGSKSAGWAMKQLYKSATEDTIALDWECGDLTERYDDVVRQIEALDVEKERIRQTVMATLGPASCGVLPGELGAWTWKSQRRKTGEIRILKRVKGARHD